MPDNATASRPNGMTAPPHPAQQISATRPAQGRANLRGLATLYAKEVRRFLKIGGQTLVAPIITTILFLTVFSVAFGTDRQVAGLPYIEFLGPGLIMMTILQNAFANTSTSLIQQKLNENIIDVLMPPLSPLELTLGYVLGGATRGLLVAVSVGVALWLIVPFSVHNLPFALIHGAGAALLMSALGMMTGIWAEKFDHVSTVTNFVILPLSFLSGTFFAIGRFPDILQTVSHFNPFFYLIDGFRYGLTGQADGSLVIGLAVVLGANLMAWTACLVMFQTGYKLKA